MRRTYLLLFSVVCLPILGCSLDTNGAGPDTTGGGQGGNGAGGASSSSGSAGAGGVGGMGGAGGAGGQGGAGGGGPTCPTNSTPMVLVQGPQGPYCIDATEVTSAQYNTWLATAQVNPNDPQCGWKQTYAPRAVGNQCNASHFDPGQKPNFPVSCVDWCDARAFCEGVGKRLCRGLAGQAINYGEFADPQKSEWTFACSEGGQRNYPYGDEFVEERCVDDAFDGSLNAGSGDPELTKAATMCEGGFAGLFDMSGNVWEWEDVCEADTDDNPRNDRCRDRGGSFWDQEYYLSCTSPSVNRERDNYNKNVGIRCCADALGMP